MSPPRLYRMCLVRVAACLAKGQWKSCPVNPFCSLPCSVVDDLLCSGDSVHSVDALSPLLSSGQLRHVDLRRRQFAGLLWKLGPLLRALLLGCRKLQFLAVPDPYGPSASWSNEVTGDQRNLIESLQTLLLNCPSLEQLYSAVDFDSDSLRRCRSLRTLRLHLWGTGQQGPGARFFKTGAPSSEFTLHLESLEVFELCPIKYSPQLQAERVAAVLGGCPELTSLGHRDTFKALETVHRREGKAYPTQYKLRVCYWEVRARAHSFSTVREFERYKSDLPGAVRTAVLSCPLVEELWVSFSHHHAIAPLSGLGRLTFLDLNFDTCEGDFIRPLLRVLDRVGPRLRHLSVQFTTPMAARSLRGKRDFFDVQLPVDLVCGLCPHLESLRLLCDTMVDDPEGACEGLRNLKHLTLEEWNADAALFLLSNTPHLTDLFVRDAGRLEDSCMLRILQRNPLPELRVAYMNRCSLTEWALGRFVRGARALEEFCLESRSLSLSRLKGVLEEANRDVTLSSKISWYWNQREYFNDRSQKCLC